MTSQSSKHFSFKNYEEQFKMKIIVRNALKEDMENIFEMIKVCDLVIDLVRGRINR